MNRLPFSAESIPSRTLPPGYAVVEFGVGSYPFPPDPTVLQRSLAIPVMGGKPNPHWSFTEGRSYTAVDGGVPPPRHDYLGTPGQIHEKARREFASYSEYIAARRPGESIRFVFADAEETDIAPGSVDELLLSNVFSSDITDEKREDLARLAKAALAVGGLLVVRETLTPFKHLPFELIPILRHAGFTACEVVSTQHPAFEALTEYYGPTLWDQTVPAIHEKVPSSSRYFFFAQ